MKCSVPAALLLACLLNACPPSVAADGAATHPAVTLSAESKHPSTQPGQAEPPAQAQPPALQPAWLVEGDWMAVAVDPASGVIYASTIDGQCIQIDGSGREQRRFQLAAVPLVTVLRTARFSGDQKTSLVTSSLWGDSVQVWDSQGQPLWTYKVPDGVDDVWTYDLNGDGLDELIIGGNGGVAGLQVIDSTGKLLWRYTRIANVWHVCAGDLDGDGNPEVISTSAAGKVHVFSSKGKAVATLDAGVYANMVRLVGPSSAGGASSLVVGPPFVGLDPQGRRLWSVPWGEASILSMMVATSHPWVAAAMRGGVVLVVDVAKGKVVGQASALGNMLQVAWTQDKKTPPLLLVATGNGLAALRVANP